MPRRARLALFGALAGIVLLAIAWLAVFHVGVLERADQKVYRGFSGYNGLGPGHWWQSYPHNGGIAGFIAGLCSPNPYVYLAAVPVLVGLVRRRPRLALGAGAIMFGANFTTQLLKVLLAHPRPASVIGGVPPINAASWPSGHATAAMSLALSSVLVAPARLRPAVAALGAVFAVAVSYSFLWLGWHYPSDVLGGFMVASIWTLFVLSVLFALERRGARGPTSTVPLREALRPPAAAVVGALALGALVAIARPHDVIAYARLHTAFVVGAASIGALGLALATGIMLAMRR